MHVQTQDEFYNLWLLIEQLVSSASAKSSTTQRSPQKFKIYSQAIIIMSRALPKTDNHR